MCDGANKSVRDSLLRVYKSSGKLRVDPCACINTTSSYATAIDGQRERNLNSKAAIVDSSPVSPRNASDDDVAQRRAANAVGSRLKHIVDPSEVFYTCLEADERSEAAPRYVTAHQNFNAIVDKPICESAVASRFAQER